MAAALAAKGFKRPCLQGPNEISGRGTFSETGKESALVEGNEGVAEKVALPSGELPKENVARADDVSRSDASRKGAPEESVSGEVLNDAEPLGSDSGKPIDKDKVRPAEDSVCLLPANWTGAAATIVTAYLGGSFLWQITPLLLDLGTAASQRLGTAADATSGAVWVVAAIPLLTSAVLAVPLGAKTSSLSFVGDTAGAKVGGGLRNNLRAEMETGARLQNNAGEEGRTGSAAKREPSLRRAVVSLAVTSAVGARSGKADWVALKSATLAVAGLALGALVNLDYALALLSAVFLVPICLLARPVLLLEVTKVEVLQRMDIPDAVASTEGQDFERQGPLNATDAAVSAGHEPGTLKGDQPEEIGTPAKLSSASRLDERLPSMAALCEQVRANFAAERRRRQEARAASRAGRLRATVKGAALWLLDRRRAAKAWANGKLRRRKMGGQRSSRRAIVKQMGLLLGATLLSVGPFSVLAWEEGQGPSVRTLIERVRGSSSIAMPWLIAGYLPTVALCLRVVFSSPCNPQLTA